MSAGKLSTSYHSHFSFAFTLASLSDTGYVNDPTKNFSQHYRWANTVYRGVHGDEDDDNSADAGFPRVWCMGMNVAGIPREWIWQLRDSRGDGYYYDANSEGMVGECGCEKFRSAYASFHAVNWFVSSQLNSLGSILSFYNRFIRFVFS